MTAAGSSLYACDEFLDVIAQVYFPGQRCTPKDYRVDGQVFRLLTAGGMRPVLRQTFIDMHEPLSDRREAARLPGLPRLPDVARSPVPLEVYMDDVALKDGFGAPAILWESFVRWDDYLELLKARRFAAEDRRRGRRLEGLLGPLRYADDDTAPDVLPTCMAWKSARDNEAQRPDLFAIDANRHFFVEMRRRGLLRASTLRAGERLLAIWLGAVHGGRWSGWVFTFNPDPELRKFSLGRQLLYPMLESSFRAGHREFDFSIGMEHYKLDFATHVRPVSPLGLPPAHERLADAGRRLLRQHPWWADRARTVRGWLQRSAAR
jgi:hypothetical protein